MSPKRVFIDFETRSFCDLRACGQSVYARDATTEVLCLCWASDDYGREVMVWQRGDSIPAGLRMAINRGYEMHAHNAAFEIAIWQHVMATRHKWPRIPLRQWHCTAARCAVAGLPRKLDEAAKALGLDEQKDGEGHKLMMKMSKPRKPTKNDASTWRESPEDMARLIDYCKQDVRTEMAVHNATPDISDRERATWLLSETINGRGVPVDLTAVELAIGVDDEISEALNRELCEITGGEVDAATKVGALLNWLNGNDCDIYSLQKHEVAEALANDATPKACKNALQIRQQAARVSVAKLRAMRNRADEDGRIRGVHLFYGAQTGRWSGMGVQFQNVPRPSLSNGDIETAFDLLPHGRQVLEMAYTNAPDTLVSCLRGMVRAQNGRFLISDFAAIEARVLAWLAGERQLIDAFIRGDDVYTQFAERLENGTRQLGKIAILGLGYGMGAKKFGATAESWGIAVSEEFAEDVVTTYRHTYADIKSFWWRLNTAAIDAVQLGGVRVAGPIKFQMDGRWLLCRLPCGRCIRYYDAQVRNEPTPWGEVRPQLSYMTRSSYTQRWERTRTYGGKLCENIVQGTARDLLVDAMFRLEAAGYPVVFHVHDEVVIETDRGGIDEVNRIMAETPQWAAGCPVAAEGYESERYRK